MNFEEMLNAQEGLTPKREKLTIGEFYRKQIDGKYRFVVDLKSSLTDSIAFCEALKAEEQWSLHQRSKHQLHYASKQEGNVLELELEGGNWQTLSQVMFANPAVVAQKGFVDQIVEGLMEAAQKLHTDSVYHLCFAPQNIFLRKGDAMPMLLTHGSFYLSLGEQKDLYEGVENFMAPEVLAFFANFAHVPAPHGMEQLADVVDRAGDFLWDRCATEGDVLVSTHAIAMKGMLEYLTPESHGSFWSKYLGNCEIWVVDFGDDGFGVPRRL